MLKPQYCLCLSNTPQCGWTLMGISTILGAQAAPALPLGPWRRVCLLSHPISPARLCLPHILRQGLRYQSSDCFARAEDPARGESSVEWRGHSQPWGLGLGIPVPLGSEKREKKGPRCEHLLGTSCMQSSVHHRSDGCVGTTRPGQKCTLLMGTAAQRPWGGWLCSR